MSDKARVIEELSDLSESIRRRVEDADDAYGLVNISLKYWKAIDDAIAILKTEVIPVEWLEEYDDAYDNVLPIALAIKAWRNR